MPQRIYPISFMGIKGHRTAGAIMAWNKWCVNIHADTPQYCEFLSIFLSHGNAREEFRCHMFHEELENSNGCPRRCERCLSLDEDAQ